MAGFYVNAVGDQYFVAEYDEGKTADKVTSWLELAKGIETVETDDDDETDEKAYYDGDGSTSTEVTGGTYGYSFSGDRYRGDAAQDLIAGKRFKKGRDRYVFLKHVQEDGTGEMGLAVVQDIVDGGGDANAKGAFECSIHYNEPPVDVSGSGATVTDNG
jgi:hypothetical protein